MNRMVRLPSQTLTLALVAALVLSFLTAGVSLAQVASLKVVPSDSLVVVRVKNLADASKKFSELCQKLGIAAFVPQVADPLGSLKQEYNITKGLKEDGELLVSILPPPAAPAGADAANPEEGLGEDLPDPDDVQVIVFVPVTDYKDFIGNFADAQTTGKLTKATTPDGTDLFIADAGNGFAAMTDAQTLLTKKPALGGIAPAGLTAKQFADHDFAAYANMPAIRKIALPKLQAERADIIARFEEKMADATPERQKYIPVMRVALNQLLDGAKQFLTDAEAGTWGMTIGDTGINGTWVAQFGASTPFGSRISKIRNSDSSMLAGLAQMPYLSFGGSELDPAITGQILDDLLAPTMAELEKVEDAKPIIKWLDGVKAYQKSTKSQSMGWAVPTGPLGQEAIMQVVGVSKGDSKAMIAAQKDLFESQQETMKLFSAAQGEVTTTYTPKAKELDGVTFDEMKTTFNFDPKTPQEMQAQQMLTFFYGPDGMNAYISPLDDKTLLSIVGGNDALISKAIAGAKKGDAPLAALAPVKQVAAKLPQNRVVAVYVPLDEIAKTAVKYAREQGFPAQVQLPPNLPPIGATIGSEGPALRVDTHVPTQLIQSLIAAGMQAFMQMQRGAGAPGGL